ncbi:MAG: hypothetical protein QOF81_3632 [Acidimicrobiaceae bacterium]|nr:hypothetical protein [Acidimicrobiaceae bacterium]
MYAKPPTKPRAVGDDLIRKRFFDIGHTGTVLAAGCRKFSENWEDNAQDSHGETCHQGSDGCPDGDDCPSAGSIEPRRRVLRKAEASPTQPRWRPPSQLRPDGAVLVWAPRKMTAKY